MSTAALAAAVLTAYALGALMLAGEAAVRIQQYVAIFHEVNWVGPVFLANGGACLVVVVGLVYQRTRRVRYGYNALHTRNRDREKTAEGAKTAYQSQSEPYSPISGHRFRTLKVRERER